jgi:hypothetical protein
MPERPTKNYQLTASRRETAARLAQTLIPDSPLGPSADEAHVATQHLDRALQLRPDRVALFENLVDEAAAEDPRQYLEALQRTRPRDFEIFTFLVAGAYFLDPKTKDWLGYQGQGPSPDPGPGKGEPSEQDLLGHTLSHGKTYRPTTWKPAVGAKKEIRG